MEIAPAGGALDNAFVRYVKTLEERGTSTIEFPYQSRKFKGWFRSTVVAIDEERIAISFSDISERKRHEEATAVAFQEFRHRVKNLLSVVSSLVGHARRTATTPEAMAETIQRQLQALGAAQDLLVREQGETVLLADIVTSALRPLDVPDLRIEEGPDLSTPTAIVFPLALVLHELATNAMKHGALSVEGGRATIGWGLQERRACLTWTESNGPPVVASARKGFGSMLFRMLGQKLEGGNVMLDYPPDGFRASIEFDVSPR